jgi:hypothetical protein
VPVASQSACNAKYVPRLPAETVLCGIVRGHLESFLDYTKTHYDKPLPRYVENELPGGTSTVAITL